MMNMHKILTTIVLFATAFSALAQSQPNSKTFSDRYDKLVKVVGPAGVGIETVLQNWEKVDSADVKMLKATQLYYFTKSRSSEIRQLDAVKYLGADPVVTLKDSLGNDVRYFEVSVFDDELFGKSLRAIEKAIAFYPQNLDLRFNKTAALLDFEKESPDMTLASLIELVDLNEKGVYKWTYEGFDNPDRQFVRDAIQEYCFSFYTIGSDASLEAFRKLSEHMLKYDSKSTVCINNIGSYYQKKGDVKAALKYYGKSLKLDPDNYPAIKNCSVIAIRNNDSRLMKKYLPMLMRCGSENEKKMAATRLELLNKKQ